MKLAKNTLRTCISAFIAASSVSVFASSITFDFEGTDKRPTTELSFEEHGLGLTVEAGTFKTGSSKINSGFNIFKSRFVDLDEDGLGAVGFFDGDQIDGNFGNDLLVFNFSQPVSIDTIFFGNVDKDDNFAFGNIVGSTFDRDFSFKDVFETVSLGSDFGASFGIGAIGAYDNFTITGLQVSKIAVPELDAAGAPIALSLIAGFAAMAAERRRKRRKS